ncbi:MAG: cytochrome b [Marinobacterium sp.]
MDTKAKLSHTSVALHWIVALLMIGSMVIGLILEEMERSPEKFDLLKLHMTAGAVVLGFAVWRLIVRIRNGFPVSLSDVPPMQKKLSIIVMSFLIAATLFMPISGVLMQVGEGHAVIIFGMEVIARSNTEIEWVEKLGHIGHGLGSKLLMLALFLHVAASFKHMLFAKDGTMARIFGKRV